jgi:hypothetical protein
VRAGAKTVAAAELCRLSDKQSTMVRSLFDRVHFANRFVHWYSSKPHFGIL